MHFFSNALYVSQGATQDLVGLEHAIRLAHHNDARLKVLILTSNLPKDFSNHQSQYETSLKENAQKSIDMAQQALGLKNEKMAIEVDLFSPKQASSELIEYVKNNEHDILIKEAESAHDNVGFKALDMALLRRCPCEVYLCRSVKNSQAVKVAVAIDPEVSDQNAKDLSVKMLKNGQFIAEKLGVNLDIFSCWNYHFEGYLTGNQWINASTEDIEDAVEEARTSHEDALNDLIQQAKLDTSKINLHLMRGKASEEIAQAVTDHNIDILLMGTVARTGIKGFIFGNTAENIMQSLDCSLLAFKPRGLDL